jgi:hypothetical protein
MDQSTLQHGVPRLWCFASPDLESRVHKINEKYRWARIMRVPQEELPKWCGRFSGEAYILGESYGGYNGFLGYPGEREIVLDRGELRRALQKKHPAWSESKIERAITASSRLTADKVVHCGGMIIKAEDILGFFESVCAVGHVTLLLDDGGTVNVRLAVHQDYRTGVASLGWNMLTALDLGPTECKASPNPFLRVSRSFL